MGFGVGVIVLAGLLTLLAVKDTLPWAHAEGKRHAAGQTGDLCPRYPANISDTPTTREVFTLMSWRDQRMAALSQAGLVEKFVDALVWVFFPVYLHQRGLSLAGIGWVVGVYGLVWGVSQFATGHWSDRVGRKRPIVAGMGLCGAGVALVVLGEGELWWAFAAAVMGFGMALLYPTLSAAVSDIAHPGWRGSAIGIYRFWRDLGYGIGALLLGAVASLFDNIEAGFWFTAAAMIVSGLVVLVFCEETHPRLNPASPQHAGNPD
jgi:MFS family permease